jgi:hypothetical protein
VPASEAGLRTAEIPGPDDNPNGTRPNEGIGRGDGVLLQFFILHRLRIRLARRQFTDATGTERFAVVVFLSNLRGWMEKTLTVKVQVTELDRSFNDRQKVELDLRKSGRDLDPFKISLSQETFLKSDDQVAAPGTGFQGPTEYDLARDDHSAFLLFESTKGEDRIRIHGSPSVRASFQPQWNQFFSIGQDFRFRVKVWARRRLTDQWVPAKRHYGVIFRDWNSPKIGRESVDDLRSPAWNEIHLWERGDEDPSLAPRPLRRHFGRRWRDDPIGPYP